jgi:hypothetical protein
MSGHYRMHRGWMDNPALGGDREPFCRRAAWAWLIENAQWKAAKINIGGRTETIERGQLCHSYRHLAATWKWSICKVQLFIEHLKNSTMIKTEVNTGRLIITICNYERYQAPLDASNTPDNTVENTAAVREQYESKESKKQEYTNGPVSVCVGADSACAREERTHSSPPGSGNVVPIGSGPKIAPLPDGWTLPDEWREWALSIGWEHFEISADRFAAHWISKRDRMDRDAANSAAAWFVHWQGWVKLDQKRGRNYGAGNYTNRKRDGGLAAVARADCEASFGDTQGRTDDW